MFYNRKTEIKKIKDILKTKGNLIIIYGRRRIGKSTLLRKIIKSNDVYFLSDLRETSLQISALQTLMKDKIEAFDKIIIPEWDTFFTTLKSLSKKFTLILDEFPYLVKNAPSLPSIIQKHIDLGTLNNINLVLCGSSQSMMTNLFQSSKAPLYGRSSMIFKVDFLSVFYLKEMLGVTAKQAIEEYSVWGGVPRYWMERFKYNSFYDAVFELVLNKYGLFYDEPIILFLDEMRTSIQSNSILSVIASGANKLSEIAGRLNKPATHISKPMQLLTELGYLRRETPFGELEKNTKKSLYKIGDPFLRFYFNYVVPNRTLIETEQIDIVKEKMMKGFNQYVSETYEELCRKCIPFLFRRHGNFTRAKRYWTKEVEVDLISKDAYKDVYIVGEVKWNDNIKLNSVIGLLNNKIAKIHFLKNKKIIKVVFGKKHLTTKTRNYFAPEDVIKAFQ